MVTANGNFGLACKRPKKEETSPGDSVTAEVLMGGDKRSLPSGKKDLQFNISRSVAKTRCIFIGSLAKSGNEIIFG
jgi:hypothetical protein